MCANVGNTDYVMKAFNTFSKATQSYNLSPAMVHKGETVLRSRALYFSYSGDSGEVESGKLDSYSKSLICADREEACEVTRMFISSFCAKRKRMSMRS